MQADLLEVVEATLGYAETDYDGLVQRLIGTSLASVGLLHKRVRFAHIGRIAAGPRRLRLLTRRPSLGTKSNLHL